MKKRKIAFKIEETAKWLGVSGTTIRRGILSGEIPAIKIRLQYLIPRSFLEKIAGSTNFDDSEDSKEPTL